MDQPDADDIDEEGGQSSSLVFDGGKRCRLFLIDYGESMFAGTGQRFLMAMRTVRNLISDIAVTGDVNELCSLIFVNTSNTNEKAQNIDSIYVYRELGTMDVELVKDIDEILNASDPRTALEPKLGKSSECSWIDVFYVCRHTIRYSGHVLRKKHVYLLTNDQDTVEENIQERVHTRLEDFLKTGAQIEIFLMAEDGQPENPDATEFWEGVGRVFRQTDLQYGFRCKKYALRSTISLPFKLAGDLEFSVGLYYLIKPQEKPRAIPMIAETMEKVEQRTHFVPIYTEQNGDGQEGERFEGEVNFAHDVGGVNVVLDREEFEKLRRFDEPGITVIGFKPLSMLKDSYRVNAAKYIYPLDTVISGSSNLYRALLKRCLEKKLFILVRYTQKRNTAPRLCALVPQSADSALSAGSVVSENVLQEYLYEGFHLLEIPFADEARDLSGKHKPPEDVGSCPAVNEQQVVAAKEFVARLINNKFSPDNFTNPVLQRHYKAVETVAFGLDFEAFEEETAEMDKLQPYFKDPKLQQRVAVQVNRFREACTAPDEKKPRKKRKKEDFK